MKKSTPSRRPATAKSKAQTRKIATASKARTKPATTHKPTAPKAEATPHWSSSTAFFLATVGSAIGLGNIWRFAWLTGSNGGGAFIVVYLGAVLLIGLPLMLAEFSVGKHGGANPARAYAKIAPKGLWWGIGALGITACSIILAYYAVITGWVLHYFVLGLSGHLTPAPAEGYGTLFTQFQSGWQPVIWQALVMAATGGIIAAGVTAGIERLCKILMPTLAVIIVALAIYANTLPGAWRGLAFLLVPDWSVLTNPNVYLAALGQAFFSLSVGYGVMLTYGAYAGRHQSLPQVALLTSLGDTAFALIAGLVVFPAVFAFGLNPAAGTGLAFNTLPQVFAVMPYGNVFGTAFFGLLLGAALTSTVSMLEVGVAALTQKMGWKRSTSAWLLTAVIFAAGVPVAMGYGPLSGITIHGLNLLDAYDYATSNILLPLTAFFTAVFVGWRWNRLQAEATSGLGRAGAALWMLALRYLVPLAILAIAAHALGLI